MKCCKLQLVNQIMTYSDLLKSIEAHCYLCSGPFSALFSLRSGDQVQEIRFGPAVNKILPRFYSASGGFFRQHPVSGGRPRWQQGGRALASGAQGDGTAENGWLLPAAHQPTEGARRPSPHPLGRLLTAPWPGTVNHTVASHCSGAGRQRSGTRVAR